MHRVIVMGLLATLGTGCEASLCTFQRSDAWRRVVHEPGQSGQQGVACGAKPVQQDIWVKTPRQGKQRMAISAFTAVAHADDAAKCKSMAVTACEKQLQEEFGTKGFSPVEPADLKCQIRTEAQCAAR